MTNSKSAFGKYFQPTAQGGRRDHYSEDPSAQPLKKEPMPREWVEEARRRRAEDRLKENVR